MDVWLVGAGLVALFAASIAFESAGSALFLRIGSGLVRFVSGGRRPTRTPGGLEVFLTSLVGLAGVAVLCAGVVLLVRAVRG